MSVTSSKRTAKPKADSKAEPPKDRAIAFRAPDEIHGALKQITGWLEMSKTQFDGRIPFERDVLMWLVSDLWMDGPDKWASRFTKAHDNHKKFVPTASN